MYLQLNNVRQHLELEVNLPDSGLYRIEGRSGAGKSTVFDSILEALYGGVQDIVPWGSTKSKIELEINEPKYLKIVRTKGPGTLTVTDAEGKEYKDDAAQALIDETVGMSEHEFLACCYIQQDMFGSLLSLTPAEQLKFIQRLGQTRLLPEEIKAKILTMIAMADVEHGIAIDGRDRARVELKQLQEEIYSEVAKLREPVKPVSDLEDLTKQKTECKYRIASNDTALKQLYGLVNSKIYNDIETFAVQKSEFSKFVGETTEKINLALTEKEKAAAELAKFTGEFADIEGHLMFLDGQLQYIMTAKKITALKADVANRFGPFEGKTSDFLTSISEKAEAEKSQIVQSISTLQASIATAKGKPQKCPDCGSELYVDSGRISKAPVSEATVKLAQEQIADLKKQLEPLNASIGEANRFKARGQELMANLNSQFVANVSAEADIRAEYARVNNLKTEIALKKQSVEVLEISLKNYASQIAKRQVEMAEKEKKIQEFTKNPAYQTRAQLNNEITGIMKDTEETQSRLVDVEVGLGVWQEYNRQADAYNVRKEFIEKSKLKVQEWVDKVAAFDREVETKAARIGALHKLKELNDFAAVAATEIIIEHINVSAQEYLDKLFPDTGTSIKIKNSKTTKTGEERAKLSLEIFHKGKTPKSIAPLSGGEKSRACLAFQLALADLYKTRILLIDEGFKGLAPEDKEGCMEILRQVSEKRLVIVIEHGASDSLFDDVVRL